MKRRIIGRITIDSFLPTLMACNHCKRTQQLLLQESSSKVEKQTKQFFVKGCFFYKRKTLSQETKQLEMQIMVTSFQVNGSEIHGY